MLQLATADCVRRRRHGAESEPPRTPSWWRLPRGVEAKARLLDRLNLKIMARTRFFDSALRSVEDGLIIAGADGRITFVNRRAAGYLGSNEQGLIGRNLFERLAEAEGGAAAVE